MMLIGTAVLAVPCYLAKQSQILCYIVVGALVGTIKGSSGCTWAEEMHLSTETAAALYDLGILFVLFMGGMEVDIAALKKAWKLVLINGMGQICLNLGSFCVITVIAASGPFKGMDKLVLIATAGPTDRQVSPAVSTFFFGVCCTLSSTILVLGALKKRGEMATLHGQIILGLMVLQDVTAVLTIAVMVSAFNPNLPPEPIGKVLGGLIMWLFILPLFLFLVNRFLLDRIFR
jgi:CPA2 family monovalent cation:H+ antiporter-2